MKKLLPAAALLPLAACIKFGSEPPASLLTIRPAAELPIGETRSSGTAPAITIAVPSVPQELSTTRIPVHSTATTLAYVKDAQWVEQPGRMFARVLSDTIAARTGRVVLSARQSLTDPGAVLTGELRSFGVDARTQQAVVVYDASLMRDAATAFEKRRFEARVPIAQVAARPVADALDSAANQVAAEVAEWVGS
ncbi:ABC-type transport auxiliary lipoprotein family protein [Sphingosinithalassobacter sp. CS137]|uniref:ABC-type transport auxiliary lipoprotein family protein n=1 Tax=Sphingosinithalassobacter sp. CS137 TaxID=2762748 RepID=UPI00165D6397|nr:ABC-type transport auxiliary lipoprotein family protein [Sphingosinithalassobacter sp. CS137]